MRAHAKRGEPELRDVHYHIFGIAGANQTEQALGMMTEVTNHLAGIEQYLKQHPEWIVTHFNYMEVADDTLQTFDLLLSMVLEDRLRAAVYIQDLIDKRYAFRRGIQALLQGKLTIDLIPPTLFYAAVIEVTNYLKREHPRFSVAFTNAAFYYDNSKPLFVREDQHLVIYVRMPIVSEEHLFRVYEILTFPVPITVPGQSRKDALQVAGLPPQVPMSLSRRYYIPMHSMSWVGCYGETILLCKDIPYMKKVSDDTCIAALFRRDQEGVTRRCDLDYLLNPDLGEMDIYLDNRPVLIVQGQLICGSRPPVKTRIENYAKLAIGCDCAFQTVGASIPYSFRACQTRVINTNV